MDTKLAELKLTPWVLTELNQHGYEVIGDMQHLSAAEILRIPGVGGRDWRKIAKALGRDPYPGLKNRR
jgi:DNA-directed RNA polymerase alpha subunit